MRKISSKEKEKKKKQRNQLLVGGILIFVMLFSTIGYAFQGQDTTKKKLTYNGEEFLNDGGYWQLEKDGIEFIFRTNPQETILIEENLNGILDYYSQPLYLSSTNSIANSQIYANFNQLVTRMQFACLENSSCEGDFPVKNCESNFIIITESNESKISQNDGCVYIQGSQEEIPKLVDSFILKILGIN